LGMSGGCSVSCSGNRGGGQHKMACWVNSRFAAAGVATAAEGAAEINQFWQVGRLKPAAGARRQAVRYARLARNVCRGKML